MKRLIVILFGVLIVVFNGPAESRPLHHRSHAAAKVHDDSGCNFTNIGRVICGPAAAAGGTRVVAVRRGVVMTVDEGTIIGGRPGDCPHAYCGCGLRKYLGLSDKRLNLASNWRKLFPRAAGPAAGVAAVRSGHVMYIESSAGDGQWLVRDYNSGGGLSRLHVRDVRGYVFVNPHSPLQTQLASRTKPPA
jgi:hypothetical protein